MVSMIAFEVYGIIIPLMSALLSFVVPVTFFNKLVADVVLTVERPLGKRVTIMAVVAIVTSFSFLLDFMAWQDFSQNPKYRHHADISLKLQHEAKRLRLERNLYIHMLASALCLAVKKIASLLRPRAAAVSVPANQTQAQTSVPPTKAHKA